MQLTEDARDGKAGGVSVEADWKIRIEMTKDGGGGKTTLEFIESFLSLGGPHESLILPEERSNGGCNTGVTVNKATIKVGKAEEDLNILDAGGGRPLRDCSNTIWLHGDAVGGNDEAEEGDGGGVEVAFAEFTGQAVLAEPGKDLFDMRNMLFEGVGIDEDIIKVNDAEDIEEIAKTIVGVGLERRRGVG
jgi:hypothetical protein